MVYKLFTFRLFCNVVSILYEPIFILILCWINLPFLKLSSLTSGPINLQLTKNRIRIKTILYILFVDQCFHKNKESAVNSKLMIAVIIMQLDCAYGRLVQVKYSSKKNIYELQTQCEVRLLSKDRIQLNILSNKDVLWRLLPSPR